MPDRILRLERFLPYRLNRISEKVSQRFAAVYKARYGLTRPEWRSLAALGETAEMTATDIGAQSSMHKTKVSRAISALEARGWLTRKTDDQDRRIEHLALTVKGRRAYQDLAGVAADYARDLEILIGAEAGEALEKGLLALERAFDVAARTDG